MSHRGMNRLAEVASAVDQIAPRYLAEPWDNVGLLVGDPQSPVSRVLVAIDCTHPVVSEAEARGCQAIVAYHPVIFDGLKRVVQGSVAWAVASKGLGVVSPHTALDAARGGTNDVLADVVGMTDRAPLRTAREPEVECKLVTFVPAADVQRVGDALFRAGAGRIGNYTQCSFRLQGTGTFFGGEGTSPVVGLSGRLETTEEVRLETVVPLDGLSAVIEALRTAHPYEEPAFDLVRLVPKPKGLGMGRIGGAGGQDRAALLRRIARGLGVAGLLVAGPRSGPVSRVAVCAGAGGDLLRDALAAGADLYLTGELRHHDALLAEGRQMTVVAALHSNSERIALDALADNLSRSCPGIEWLRSESDRDPFVWVHGGDST